MRDIPPVESLVDALHDPIHPASGSLIRSQPVKGAGGVDKTDIVWRLRANWSYLGREAADEITRLRAEVERLQITGDEQQAMMDGIYLCEEEAGTCNEKVNAHAWAKAAGLLRGLLERRAMGCVLNDATSTREGRENAHDS